MVRLRAETSIVIETTLLHFIWKLRFFKWGLWMR
jgi:hypothetical protein